MLKNVKQVSVTLVDILTPNEVCLATDILTQIYCKGMQKNCEVLQNDCEVAQTYRVRMQNYCKVRQKQGVVIKKCCVGTQKELLGKAKLL